MPPEKKKESKGAESAVLPLTGVFMFPNGDKYDGQYIQMSDKSIVRSGIGTHTAVSGTIYEGRWADDKMSGHGRITFPSSALYDGEFVDNQFHGDGKYTWNNGSFYEGHFCNNILDGEGQFTDTEKQVWTGMFRHKAAVGLQFKLERDT